MYLDRRDLIVPRLDSMENNYTQVCVWASTIVGKEKSKEFEDYMKSEYKIRAKYVRELKTIPDQANGKDVEGTGGRNDVFFTIHTDDIPKFAIPRLSMDPPVRWIEDVIDNGGQSIYQENISVHRTW